MVLRQPNASVKEMGGPSQGYISESLNDREVDQAMKSGENDDKDETGDGKVNPMQAAA